MTVRELTVGPIGTHCYLLSAEGRADCVIIDPGAEAARIREAVGSRTIAAILLTHGHFDHIGAVSALMEESTRLFVHPLDAPMLSDPALNAGLGMMGEHTTAPAPTDLLRDEETLALAGLSLQVLHTPGHTQGSVCFQADTDLFTGDTLFHHGWGRTDLPGGSQAQMMASLRRVIPLARTLRVRPGHEG